MVYLLTFGNINAVIVYLTIVAGDVTFANDLVRRLVRWVVVGHDGWRPSLFVRHSSSAFFIFLLLCFRKACCTLLLSCEVLVEDVSQLQGARASVCVLRA